MKKLFALLMLGLTLTGSAFSISIAERLLLPKFEGDLSTVSYKVIEENGDVWIIEVNGVTYIYKLK